MRKIYTIVFAVLASISLSAQDYHYSQFFNAPMILNPALTGFTNGTYRIGINYRNQWFSAAGANFGATQYMTTAIGGDVPIPIKGDILGVGLFLANDQSGGNTFSQIQVCASVAYIKTLGKKKNHRLSVGFQLGGTSYSVNTSNFQFPSQFQDNVFNSSLSNNETYSKTHIGFFNLNAGLLWSGKFSDVVGMYAGGSLFNLAMSKEDILAGQSLNQYLRYNIHGGFDFTLAKKFHLLPALMFMSQSTVNELNVGLGFGIDFSPGTTLTLGVYDRINTLSSGANNDGVIPYIGIEFKGFKLGLSYDATTSSLKSAGSGVGAFEISLSYTGKRKEYDYKNAMICPRF